MAVNWKIEAFDTLASTQDYIKNLGPLKHGVIIQAQKQTAGYGRHGRVWEGGDDNLILSIALIPDMIECRLPYIGLLALGCGAALCQTIQSYNKDLNITLKWPNDVLINNQKCAGILVERHDDALILGVGLNVTTKPEPLKSTCLKDIGITNKIDTIRCDFLKNLELTYTDWINEKYDQIHSYYSKFAFTYGQNINVKLQEKHIAGTYEGVNDFGALNLRDFHGKIHTITAGEVFLQA